MTMRRVLGSLLPALVAVTVLASGCGDEEAGTASDDSTPAASSSPTGTDLPPDTPTQDPPSEDPPGGEVDFELVETITETAAGGTTSEVAVPLGDQAAVEEFTAQFERDALPTRVHDAVAATEVPEGMLLYGAVIAIGCDTPTQVHVVASGSGLLITAGKVPSPMVECFAPMTTVALVLVPAAAVG